MELVWEQKLMGTWPASIFLGIFIYATRRKLVCKQKMLPGGGF